MKKSLFLFALGLVSYMPAQAQWTHYGTQTAISGVFGAINHSIESAERKKQMEIFAQEKTQYEQSFKDAMYGTIVTPEGVTAVKGIPTVDGNRNTPYYDLLGRQLNGKPTQKGVYINKGNKVVIK